jgi:beta-lactamase superfamily II metal-dependent hydrolase
MTRKTIPDDPIARKIILYLLAFELVALLPVVILSFTRFSFIGLCLASTVFLISAGVLVLLNSRYQAIPVVKKKRALTDRVKVVRFRIRAEDGLITKAGQIRGKLTTAERNELATALRTQQVSYVRQGLAAARLEAARIPGVGPKLKERLAIHGIVTAADINQGRLAAIDGFGAAKVHATLSWRGVVLAQLEHNKPKTLPPDQVESIRQKYQVKHTANNLAEQTARENKSRFVQELAPLLPKLSAFANLTFINYLGQTLTLPGFAMSVIAAVLVVGQLCLGGGATLSALAALPPVATRTQTVALAALQTSAVQTIVAEITASATMATPTLAQPKASDPTASTLVPATAAISTPTAFPTSTAVTASEPVLPGLPGGLRFRFVNVGQGDATLIQTPGGKNILIDGGETGSGIVQYLQGLGIQRIDLMIATHPHSDHIGGLVQVLEAFPVAKVVTNGQPHTTLVYERFLDGIITAQAEYVEVRRGDIISIDGLNLDVLHPVAPTDSDLNENSLVLKFTYNQTTFLLMGDAEATAEASLLSSGLSLKADILKVGHHGSTSSSTQSFLKAVSPKLAIYSAGVNNQYNHPAPQTIASLASVGATILGTDQTGTIALTVEQSGYSFDAPVTETVPLAQILTPVIVVPPIDTNPTAAPVAQPTAAATAPVSGGLEIVSVTSPINAGANATLKAQTAPNASCSIAVNYKSGPSSAQGLGPKTANGSGIVSWTWKVGPRTTPGSWRIDVTCNGIYKSVYFTVK